MKVLVTGVSGFIGQVAAAYLCAAGHEVVGLARDPSTAPDGVRRVAVDVSDAGELTDALAGEEFGAVVHLAALSEGRVSWADPARYYQVNVGGVANLLRAVRLTDRRGFVFASTNLVYGAAVDGVLHEGLPAAPGSPYAATKHAGELLVDYAAGAGHIGGMVLRLFNVAGAVGARTDVSRSRIVPNAVRAAAGLLPQVTVNGDGSAVRDFVHVADVAAAIGHAVAATQVGKSRTVNIGSGVGVSMLDVLDAARRVSGRPVEVVHRPAADEPATLVADISAARQVLGWQPRSSTLDSIVADVWQQRAVLAAAG